MKNKCLSNAPASAWAADNQISRQKISKPGRNEILLLGEYLMVEEGEGRAGPNLAQRHKFAPAGSLLHSRYPEFFFMQGRRSIWRLRQIAGWFEYEAEMSSSVVVVV